MFWKILVLWLIGFPWVSVFCNTAYSAEGNIILDRNEIEVCGPLSGYIDLRTAEALQLDNVLNYYFSYYDGKINIVIIAPNGSEINLDDDYLHPESFCSSVGLNGFLWDPSVTIRMPIFLLKFGDKFFFDSPGTYEVKFFFNALPDIPVASVLVHVVNRNVHDKEWYVSWLANIPYLFFAHVFPPEDVSDPNPSNDYFDAYCITNVYQLGGAILKAYFMTHRMYIYDKGFGFGSQYYGNIINRATVLARQFNIHLDFWEKLGSKRRLFLDKGLTDFMKATPDSLGIFYVVP